MKDGASALFKIPSPSNPPFGSIFYLDNRMQKLSPLQGVLPRGPFCHKSRSRATHQGTGDRNVEYPEGLSKRCMIQDVKFLRPWRKSKISGLMMLGLEANIPKRSCYDHVLGDGPISVSACATLSSRPKALFGVVC